MVNVFNGYRGQEDHKRKHAAALKKLKKASLVFSGVER
jgi:hypothetical protein